MYRLGIDLGGTKTEIVVLDSDGKEHLRERRPTRKNDGYEALVNSLAGFVADVENRLGVTCTVGVGMPGSLSPATGLVRNANTTCLNGQTFMRDLATALNREVRVSNDANCFALAEAVVGAGRDATTVFGVILGTGVGGAIIMNRRVHEGRLGIAGEWGHNPLVIADDPATFESPPACYCGRHGCIETWLSGPALAADHARHAGADKLAAPDIVAAAATDARARASLERYFKRLGRALASVVNIVDPDIIVLGGGLSNMPGIAQHAQQQMQPHVFSDVFDTPVVTAAGGDSAGVLGAAWLWSDTPI